MSRSFQKPENALKRAEEFIVVQKPVRALDVLYEVLKRGKMRANYSEKLLEPIMYKFLELCVDQKKSHYAKEGLYQYRNICQSVNVSSLETVVRYYLKLAEEKTDSARAESYLAVVDVDDLDNITSPEEMLLSAVSGENTQDRCDRTILTPWVKFLWDSYRQCLELLRTNCRVEKLYHDIAKHAFKFCEKYGRKTEFRKLCENLRTHLSNIQKQQGITANAVNLNNPETQQMNLETRLEQLNYAIKMELWQEAYKAIEDISDLMVKAKKQPKPHVMAVYYQRLALVFCKAGNLLFHAAALFKLFQLLREQRKNVSGEELANKASVVMLAILAIPLPSAHPEFDRFIETEKSALEKVDRLAGLLNLPKPPTRASLIRDITRLGVVAIAPKEMQDMFNLMESDFDPLNLCSRMNNYFKMIQEKDATYLAQYIEPLKEMTVCRLVKQIGQVYQSIKFERLVELAVFVEPFHLERVLVDLVRHNDLQIRIDNRTSCVRFGVDLSESQREDLPEGPTLQKLPSEQIRCQLVDISSAMYQCIDRIYPDRKTKLMEPIRAQTIQVYQQSRKNEHQRLIQRQHIIEERKEMLENQNLEREESHRRAVEEQLKRQKEIEQARLKREASKREQERQEEQLKQIQTKQIKDKLLQISKTSYGQRMIEKFDKEELMSLGAEEILQRQVEELEKERKEQVKKLKNQDKQVDYFERARQLLELPKLKQMLSKQKAADKVFWNKQEEERIERLIQEHKEARDHCQRLSRMMGDSVSFLEILKNSRKSAVDEKLEAHRARMAETKERRLAERREQRKAERREAYFKRKADEEQQRRDEELKKAREETERLEAERMLKEEQEEKQRKEQLEKEQQQKLAEEQKSQPWRPKIGKANAAQKEQEKHNAWKVKEDEPRSRGSYASTDIRKERDAELPIREEMPENRRFADLKSDSDRLRPTENERSMSRDNRRGPPREDFMKGGRDDGAPSREDFGKTWRDQGPRDFDKSDRGSRDFQRSDRGPRDFDRSDRGPRDFDRSDRGPRDFDRSDRGPRDFDRSDRGPRDFDRSDRGPRDFDRSDRGPRDFDRSDRGPRNFDRSDRGSNRFSDSRGGGKDFGRRTGGFDRRTTTDRADTEGSWRTGPKREDKKDEKRSDSDSFTSLRR